MVRFRNQLKTKRAPLGLAERGFFCCNKRVDIGRQEMSLKLPRVSLTVDT